MFVFGNAEDVFTMAVRIEENGNSFYAGAAERTKDPKIKKLFEDLALMEEGHIMAFKSLRSRLPGSFPADTVWDPEGLAESYLQASADTHIFTVEAAKSRLENVKSPLQVIDMALQFEKDSVVFFLGMKTDSRTNSKLVIASDRRERSNLTLKPRLPRRRLLAMTG